MGGCCGKAAEDTAGQCSQPGCPGGAACTHKGQVPAGKCTHPGCPGGAACPHGKDCPHGSGCPSHKCSKTKVDGAGTDDSHSPKTEAS